MNGEREFRPSPGYHHHWYPHSTASFMSCFAFFHVSRIGLNLHTAVGLFIRKEGFRQRSQAIENRGFQLLLINSVDTASLTRGSLKGLIQVHTQITGLVGAVIHGMTESGIWEISVLTFCAESAGAGGIASISPLRRARIFAALSGITLTLNSSTSGASSSSRDCG